MKMEQTECSEMLAYKIQVPGNYPEESIKQITIVLIPRLIFCNIGGSDTTFAGDRVQFFLVDGMTILHICYSPNVIILLCPKSEGLS